MVYSIDNRVMRYSNVAAVSVYHLPRDERTVNKPVWLVISLLPLCRRKSEWHNQPWNRQMPQR